MIVLVRFGQMFKHGISFEILTYKKHLLFVEPLIIILCRNII